MVKTKSVYDSVEESDGDRILVTRYWPRGLSKKRLMLTAWLRNLAPSVELLKAWNNKSIDWQEYEVRYYCEMLSQQEEISALALKAKETTITLLCYEQERNPCCHRHLLKKLIAQSLHNNCHNT